MSVKPYTLTSEHLAEHFRALGCRVTPGTLKFDVDRLSHVEDAGPGTLSWHRGGVLPPDFAGDVLVAHSDTQINHPVRLVAYHDNPRMVLRKVIVEYGFDRIPPQMSAGARCKVHPSAVLRADGQGYDQEEDGWVAFPHAGGLRLGDDVDVGPCATIMRGSIGDTVIGDGCKIGNGVNIGHDTRIGEHTLVIAGALIAGWVRIGANVKIWQGAIIKNGIRIGDGAQIGMGAVVLEDIPAGEVWAGNPATQLQ